MLNTVCLMGRLCKDPELRTIPSANGETQSVASFRLAHDLGGSAGSEKQTLFIDVSIFGKRAETVAKFMRKGILVAVSGRLNQRKYMSTKTNTEVTVTEIIANSVDFAEPKPQDAPNASEQPKTVIETPTYVEGGAPAQPVAANVEGLEIIGEDLPF